MAAHITVGPTRKRSILSDSESSSQASLIAPQPGNLSQRNTWKSIGDKDANEISEHAVSIIASRPATPPSNDSAGSLSDTETETVKIKKKVSKRPKVSKSPRNGDLDEKTFHVISKIILPDIIFMDGGARTTFESYIRFKMLKDLEETLSKKSIKFISTFRSIDGRTTEKEKAKFEKRSSDLNLIQKSCVELTIGSQTKFPKPDIEQIFACVDPGFNSSLVADIKQIIQENLLYNAFKSIDDFATRTEIIKILPHHTKNFDEIGRLSSRSKVIEYQLSDLGKAIKARCDKIKLDLLDKHKFKSESELITALKKHYLSLTGHETIDLKEPLHIFVSKGYKLLKKEEIKKIFLDIKKNIREEQKKAVLAEEDESLDKFLTALYSKDQNNTKKYFSNSYEHMLVIKKSIYKLKLVVLEDFINHQKEQIALLTSRLSILQQYLQRSNKSVDVKNTFLISLGEHLYFFYITNFLDKHFIGIGGELLRILSIQYKRSFLYHDVKDEVKKALSKLEAKRDVIKEFQNYVADGRLLIMDETSILVQPVTVKDSNYKNLDVKEWLEGPNKTVRTISRLLCDGNDLFYRDLTNLIHIIAGLAKQGVFSLTTKIKPEHIEPTIQMILLKMNDIEKEQFKYERMTDKKAKDEIAKSALESHANNYTFLSKMLEQTKSIPPELETLIIEILTTKNKTHAKIICDIGLSRIIGTLLVLYSSPSQKHFLKALRSVTDGCRQVFDRQKAYISHSTSDVSSDDDLLHSLAALNSSGTESLPEKEPESSEELLFGKGELIIIRAFNKDYLKLEFIKDTMIDGFAEAGFLEQITVEIDLRSVTSSTSTIPPESIKETVHFHFKAPPGEDWKKNYHLMQTLRKVQLYLAMAGYPPMTIVEVSKEGKLII